MEKKIVAYYRLSKQGKKEGKGLGIEAQEQIVRHYYTPEKEFYEVQSAKTAQDRDQLQEAIQYCIQHNAYLVVAKVDRLSRNTVDCLNIWKTLKKRLYSCDIPGEIDEFTLTMYAAFAQRERDLIALRTSQALQRKIAKEGKWWNGNPEYTNGNVAKLGGQRRKEMSLTNENNISAADVICMKVAAGMKYADIVNHLNTHKHKTSTGKPFVSATQVARIYNKFCKQ